MNERRRLSKLGAMRARKGGSCAAIADFNPIQIDSPSGKLRFAYFKLRD